MIQIENLTERHGSFTAYPGRVTGFLGWPCGVSRDLPVPAPHDLRVGAGGRRRSVSLTS